MHRVHGRIRARSEPATHSELHLIDLTYTEPPTEVNDAMTKLLKSISPHVLAGLLAGFFAASCSESSSGPCRQGEACVCERDCNQSCDGAGCGFTCQDGASCDFDCADGKCGAACSGNSDCSMRCPGGTCSMTCAADSTCEIENCDGGGCTLACEGSDNCTNACGLEQGCVTTE